MIGVSTNLRKLEKAHADLETTRCGNIAHSGIPVSASEAMKSGTLYKNTGCECCEEYAKYLRSNGFEIKVVAINNLAAFDRGKGIPQNIEGCHTMMIDGYIVSGHVPIASLNRLLTERPAIKGISLPGMPAGSPGMTGTKAAPFRVYEIADGQPKVFAVE